MTAKTTAQRVKETTDRKRASGLLRYSRWIHPDDAPQMDALRDKLAKRRQKGMK
jgi:hypothetical protein